MTQSLHWPSFWFLFFSCLMIHSMCVLLRVLKHGLRQQDRQLIRESWRRLTGSLLISVHLLLKRSLRLKL